MSTTVRPDNLKAALDAKLAAAMSQLAELREAEQLRATLHLNPQEIVDKFLAYACRVHPIADAFGREQAGDLQFGAWYGQWTEKLSDADRALWKELLAERARQERGQKAALIEVEISVSSDPAITGRYSLPGARAEIPKRFFRLAAFRDRAASDVCDDYLRLARSFAHDFVRDYARFLA